MKHCELVKTSRRCRELQVDLLLCSLWSRKVSRRPEIEYRARGSVSLIVVEGKKVSWKAEDILGKLLDLVARQVVKVCMDPEVLRC